MAATELEWVSYAVPAPGRRGFNEHVAIPDLGDWPNPQDKVQILLEAVAEIEHGLLVQYLYAAFSLNGSRDVSDPPHRAALRMWKRLLIDTARDEMGHLMTVQNLLLAVGLSPHLRRQDRLRRKGLHLFTPHLEPLTQRSLAKYVTAEAPHDADIADILAVAGDAGADSTDRVGALYGLLGVVFSTEEQVIDGGSISHDWDDTLRLFAAAAYVQDGDRAGWHLGEGVINPASLAFQARSGDWRNAVPIHRIADRAGARSAILDVAVEGEGPSGGGLESHFQRYHNMFRGENGVPRFPPADFAAVRPVPTDPEAAGFGDASTRGWAELADQRYGLMLGFIEHYLLTSDADERGTVAGWTIDEMHRIAAINEVLAALPVPGAVPFGLRAAQPLPEEPRQRWAVHRVRTEASLAHVTRLCRDGGDRTDPILAGIVERDTERLEKMPAGDSALTGPAVRAPTPLNQF